jgi:hypothetical protein
MVNTEIITGIFIMAIGFGYLISMALFIDWLNIKYKEYKNQ